MEVLANIYYYGYENHIVSENILVLIITMMVWFGSIISIYILDCATAVKTLFMEGLSKYNLTLVAFIKYWSLIESNAKNLCFCVLCWQSFITTPFLYTTIILLEQHTQQYVTLFLFMLC